MQIELTAVIEIEDARAVIESGKSHARANYGTPADIRTAREAVYEMFQLCDGDGPASRGFGLDQLSARVLPRPRQQANELATMLAALRHWQEFYSRNPEEAKAAYPQFDFARPLFGYEIDALCERLNTGGN